MAANALNLLGCGAAGADAAVVKPDLTSWDFFWKMDEGSGTTIGESGAVGSGIDLTAATGGTGSITWGTDANMGGTILTMATDYGASNYARLWCGEFNYAGYTKWTGVARVKYTTTGGASKYPVLFGHFDYVGGSDKNGVILYANYNNYGLYFRYGDGGSTDDGYMVSLASAGISAGNVYCIMASLDCDGDNAKIYVNGVEVGTSDSSIGPTTIGGIGVGTSKEFCLGHDADSDVFSNGAYGFDGSFAWAAIDNSYYDPAAAAAFYAGLGL